MVQEAEVEGSAGSTVADGLDAVEVKALFEALRAMPGSLSSLRETYDRVKDRLTDSGRAAYQRELQRLLNGQQTPSELLDGEYALVIRSDDDTDSLAALHCHAGRITVDLRLADPMLALAGLVVDAGGRIEAWLLRVQEGEELSASITGKLELRDGFLFLEATIDGRVDSEGSGRREFKRLLTGTGDGRPVRA